MAEEILSSPGVLTNETEFSSAITNNQLANSPSKKINGILSLFQFKGSKLNQNISDFSTEYPSTATGTPNANQKYGGPLTPFVQKYDENHTYINSNPNTLGNTLDITTLDSDSPGSLIDTITQYPSTVTGTPTSTQNPGGPPTGFSPHYNSNNTYVNNVGLGALQNTFDITNLDIENPSVNGGPLNDIVTNYPETTTGIPDVNINWGLNPPYSSGAAAKRFIQIYKNDSKYLSLNPIALSNSGKLYKTLDITNLDISSSSVLGGPNSDTITQYPVLSTGTPTTSSNFSLTSPFNSGTPSKRFIHRWSENYTYLSVNSIANVGSGVLKDTLNITNLDVENPFPEGGPLNDTTTIYPAANVTHTSPIRGWFAEPSQPPSKFDHIYTPTTTYESFIQAYI